MKIVNLIFALLLLLTVANANNRSEDELIVKAIYYANNKKPKEAANIWKTLFEKTNNQKYLVEYFYAALSYKDIKDVIKEIKASLSKKKSKELYELLASLYSQQGDTNGVLDTIEHIQGNNVESLYELAYLYTIKGKKDKALKIYKRIYKKDKSWDALKGILSILSSQKKLDEASKILWKAIKDNKHLPKDAYLVYVGLVDYKKDTDNIIYAYKKLFLLTGKKEYIKQLISLYLYKKDYDSIIKILELTHYDNKLLYELYISKQKIVLAYKVLYKLYKDTKDPKWLAEKAILTYEVANKYKAVDDNTIKELSRLFEESFKKGAGTPTYYNYYGYTLIDYNKEIAKGIKYVKKALKKEPHNIYYLDSLAWGYYKHKECKKAKKIVNSIGSKEKKILEEDIIEHINKIKRCKER